MNTTKNQFAKLAIVEESDTDDETTQMEDDNETTPLPVDNQEIRDDVSIQIIEDEHEPEDMVDDEPVVDKDNEEDNEEENPFIDDSVVIYLDNSDNSPTTNPPGYSVWVGGHVRGDVASGAVKVNKMDTKVPLTITQSVLVNGELLTWYYNYGWYSGSNITGPFQNGCTIKIPNVSMTKLDKYKSALNFLDNIQPLPNTYLGQNLHKNMYLDTCFGSLALLKYELSVSDWNDKVQPWLKENDLLEDFNSAFSVIDKIRDLSSTNTRIDRRKIYNRRDRAKILKAKNQFLYYYVSMDEERKLLLNSLNF